MTRPSVPYIPRPLAAHRYAYPNGERYHMEREAKMYAKWGLGLAKAWRLAAKIDAREIAGQEKTRLNNLRQAEEKAARQAAKKAAKLVRPCKACGLIFANQQELRLHRQIRHHEYNPPPYHGRLLNPVNWNVPELSPSGETGRRAEFKPRHIAGSSPATGTTHQRSAAHD